MRRANTRPAAKGHKVPHRLRVFPPFGAELLGVRAPQDRVAVHQVAVAVHDVALSAECGRFAVGAAAGRQDRVGGAVAHRLEADGVEAVACLVR